MPNTISPEEYRKKYPRAVVLNAQPSGFKICDDPEELREFEKQLMLALGLPPETIESLSLNAQSITLCGPRGSAFDDCDFMP